MRQNFFFLLALMACLAACGESDGDGGGGGTGGTGGGGGGGKQALGFDPCADVFSHQELEGLMGHGLADFTSTDHGNVVVCDWSGAEVGVDSALSMMVYPRMSATDYKRTVEQYDEMVSRSGLGEEAHYMYKDSFVKQGVYAARKGGRGVFGILTGFTNTDEESEQILRQVLEGYVQRF